MKKIAIVGMGKMGSKYAKMILEKQELGFILTASTRINNENAEKIKLYLGTFKIYDNDSDLFRGYDNGEFECDAILVATPHYNHKYDVIEGFKRNLDVLCEKPAGVYLKDGREMLEYRKDNKYGFVFHQHIKTVGYIKKHILCTHSVRHHLCNRGQGFHFVSCMGHSPNI